MWQSTFNLNVSNSKPLPLGGFTEKAQPAYNPLSVIERLESRQFLSASSLLHGITSKVTKLATTTLTNTAELHANSNTTAGEASANVAADAVVKTSAKGVTFGGAFSVGGLTISKKVGLTFTKDENGQFAAKLTGLPGMKDVMVSGTHDDAGYHFIVGTAKGVVTMNATVSNDGKSLAGTLSVMPIKGVAVSGNFALKRA